MVVYVAYMWMWKCFFLFHFQSQSYVLCLYYGAAVLVQYYEAGFPLRAPPPPPKSTIPTHPPHPSNSLVPPN